MRGPENGNKTAIGFLLSALFFAFCVAVGMFYSYHMDKELFGTLSAYVSAATEHETGFKEVFAKAAKYDFKYLIIVLVSAFSVYGSFFPLLVIGFKGFSSGLAVALGARVIESLLGRIADTKGWNDVFICILIFTIVSFVLCVVSAVFTKKKTR